MADINKPTNDITIFDSTGANAATVDVSGDLHVVGNNAALETTLIQVRDYLDTVETKLQSLFDLLSRPATATLSNVASSVTSVTILSSNANRKKFIIVNDGTSNLYLKFGATASTTSFTIKLERSGIYESDRLDYTGVIDGIWDVANGSARVTELT